MKYLAFLALVAAVLAATGVAHAQTQTYGGLGYANTRDDATGADMRSVTGRLGARITPNLAIEGEAGMGVNNDDRGKLDSAYGVYGVAVAPVGRKLDVFARVGYSRVNEFGRGPLAGSDLRDDGVGYGLGAQVNVSERWGLRGDVTRHDGERDIDTIGASIVRKF
jgi:hypothetical protein